MLQISPPTRVMIVEDDEELLELYHSELSEHIEHIDAFSDAVSAAKHYSKSQKYDLVITDLKMPGRSGESLIVDIHMINPHQPIAIVSAHLNFLSLPESFPVMKFSKPVSISDVMTQFCEGTA